MEILVIILIVLLCLVSILLFKQNKMIKTNENAPKSEIASEIAKIREIGELSVFQIYSKEIVTRKDTPISGFWNSVLGWSMTKKQMVIIFEFEINFIYDLRSSSFEINRLDNGTFAIKMPPCKYKYSIKDMKIYDEKNAKFLPFLLPDMLNGLFGPTFSESDKNKLIDEAKDEVKALSVKIIADLESKIHKSASDTIEAIAKSFGAKEVKFEFCDDNTALNQVKFDGLIEEK